MIEGGGGGGRQGELSGLNKSWWKDRDGDVRRRRMRRRGRGES